jgi:hypothetical protein
VDLKLEQSQWWGIMAQIIEESHTASGEDLAQVIAEAVSLVGMTAQMYLVDLAQRALWPIPKDHGGATTVDGSLAGSAFHFVKVLAGTDPGTGWCCGFRWSMKPNGVACCAWGCRAKPTVMTPACVSGARW